MKSGLVKCAQDTRSSFASQEDRAHQAEEILGVQAGANSRRFETGFICKIDYTIYIVIEIFK
jgi:hypothetical protein